jgi:hypothetical protein
VSANKATGNPERFEDGAVAACDTLHMWEPDLGDTPDGDTLAASDLGESAAKARLTLDERLGALADFAALWRTA